MDKITPPKFKKGDIVNMYEYKPSIGVNTGRLYNAEFEVVKVMGLVYRKTDGKYPLIERSIDICYKNYSNRFNCWVVYYRCIENIEYFNMVFNTFGMTKNTMHESFFIHSKKHLRKVKIENLLNG